MWKLIAFDTLKSFKTNTFFFVSSFWDIASIYARQVLGRKIVLLICLT